MSISHKTTALWKLLSCAGLKSNHIKSNRSEQPAPNTADNAEIKAESKIPQINKSTGRKRPFFHLGETMDNISEESASMYEDQPPQRLAKETASFRTPRKRPPSLKKLRRRSEEFFRRKSPTCTSSLEADGDHIPYFVARKRAQSQANCSAANNNNSKYLGSLNSTLSSEDDSPFTNRKWRAISHETIDGPITTSSRNSLLGAGRRVIRQCQEEYCYKQVLQSVVTPLGAPDSRPGFKPQDLGQYTRQLFKIDKKVHEQRVKEVQSNKPSNIILTVSVVEAKDIKPIGSTSLSDPFCLLNVQKSRSPLVSPRSSPDVTPRNSPSTARRSNGSRSATVEMVPGVYQTRTIKSNLYPKWNEEFEVDVTNVNGEEFYLSIWDDSTCGEQDRSISKEPKHSGLKGLFKHLRHHIDYKISGGLIGHCKIPLRNIPAVGCDKWYDLYIDKKQRIKGHGQVRLKLQLSMKQGLDQLDGVESDQCSIEDYHYIVHQVYLHAITTGEEGTMETSTSGQQVFLQLSEQGRAVLNQFAAQNHFSRITQKLIELVVILEMFVEQRSRGQVSEKLLKNGVVNLELEWHQARSVHANESDSEIARKLISETEMTLFDNTALTFIRHTIQNLRDGEKPIPKLFPPCDLDMEELNYRVSIAVSLANLHLCTCVGEEGSAQKDLANVFVHRLQHVTEPLKEIIEEDVRVWVDEKLESVHSNVNEPVIPNTRKLVEILQDSLKMATPIFSVSQYFSRLNIDYFKTVAMIMESRLSGKAKCLMLQMDTYQVKYHAYAVNIRESSTVGLQLYMALRNFFDMLRSVISERELFRVSMASYQEWFQSAVTFWLQTFREECIRRMEKALEVEKDVVQVTSLVKYSNSSVDILSCFYKITSEWQQINFNDADIAVLGATKITDTICDGVKWYMEKIISILENNGYYDYIDNAQFDVTDQLCITLNNIAHIRDFLQNLPNLLAWDDVTQRLALKHERDQVGDQALQALCGLVQCAEEDVFNRGGRLLTQITQLIAKDLENYTLKFTFSKPNERSSVDELLAYLKSNLSVLYDKLEPYIFQAFLTEIWHNEISIFTRTLLKGQPAEYYRNMSSHLMDLRSYFNLEGIDETVTDCSVYCHLQERLKLNGMTSLDLMLKYYDDLTTHVATPTVSYGHIAAKVGYQPASSEKDGMVNLFVKVTGAKNLPGMLRKDVSSPYVEVSLCPSPLFKHHHPQKTEVKRNTNNPMFNQIFTFSHLQENLLQTEGAALALSIWHHNAILPDDFLGEILVALADTPRMNSRQTIEDMPAVMMTVHRPREPQDGPYQVLKDRSVTEKAAKALIEKRSLMVGYTQRYACCTPVTYVVSKFTGKKNIVPCRSNSTSSMTERSPSCLL